MTYYPLARGEAFNKVDQKKKKKKLKTLIIIHSAGKIL